MKAFAAAVIIALVAAIGSAWVLDTSFQTPAYSTFTTEGARLTHPGDNLMVD